MCMAPSWISGMVLSISVLPSAHGSRAAWPFVCTQVVLSAAMDHAVSTLRPKLTIHYQIDDAQCSSQSTPTDAVSTTCFVSDAGLSFTINTGCSARLAGLSAAACHHAIPVPLSGLPCISSNHHLQCVCTRRRRGTQCGLQKRRRAWQRGTLWGLRGCGAR